MQIMHNPAVALVAVPGPRAQQLEPSTVHRV